MLTILLFTDSQFLLLPRQVFFLFLKIYSELASNTDSTTQYTSALQILNSPVNNTYFIPFQPHCCYRLQRNRNSCYLLDFQTVSTPSSIAPFDVFWKNCSSQIRYSNHSLSNCFISSLGLHKQLTSQVTNHETQYTSTFQINPFLLPILVVFLQQTSKISPTFTP